MSKRAERRHKLKIVKERAKKILKGWGVKTTPKNVGKLASVHGSACSCSHCGNPRRKWKAKTQQEIKQDMKDRETGNADN